MVWDATLVRPLFAGGERARGVSRKRSLEHSHVAFSEAAGSWRAFELIGHRLLTATRACRPLKCFREIEVGAAPEGRS